MLYLLDANVLIDANRDYYPIGRIPEFWEWLVHHAEQQRIKVPIEVFEEVADGNDPLATWVKDSEVKDHLALTESADPAYVSAVVENGYGQDLSDDEIVKLGRDPFLIGYVAQDPNGRCVVTTEVSKPKKTRANRHIPDVCGTLGLPCINTFELLRRLDFTTSWKAGTR